MLFELTEKLQCKERAEHSGTWEVAAVGSGYHPRAGRSEEKRLELLRHRRVPVGLARDP